VPIDREELAPDLATTTDAPSTSSITLSFLEWLSFRFVAGCLVPGTGEQLRVAQW